MVVGCKWSGVIGDWNIVVSCDWRDVWWNVDVVVDWNIVGMV